MPTSAEPQGNRTGNREDGDGDPSGPRGPVPVELVDSHHDADIDEHVSRAERDGTPQDKRQTHDRAAPETGIGLPEDPLSATCR